MARHLHLCTPTMWIRARLTTVLSCLLLANCGKSDFKVTDDCACGFYTVNGSTDQMLSWPDGKAVAFEFDKNFPQELRPAVVSATATYNNVLAKSQVQINFQESKAPTYEGDPDKLARDGVNGIYYVPEPWPWNDGADTEGMTVVQFSGDAIVEADIYLRANGLNQAGVAPSITYQNLPIDMVNSASSNPNLKWARVLALHELGHALGLVHKSSGISIMRPIVWLDLADIGLADDDIQTLSQRYKLKDVAFLKP